MSCVFLRHVIPLFVVRLQRRIHSFEYKSHSRTYSKIHPKTIERPRNRSLKTHRLPIGFDWLKVIQGSCYTEGAGKTRNRRSTDIITFTIYNTFIIIIVTTLIIQQHEKRRANHRCGFGCFALIMEGLLVFWWSRCVSVSVSSCVLFT